MIMHCVSYYRETESQETVYESGSQSPWVAYPKHKICLQSQLQAQPPGGFIKYEPKKGSFNSLDSCHLVSSSLSSQSLLNSPSCKPLMAKSHHRDLWSSPVFRLTLISPSAGSSITRVFSSQRGWLCRQQSVYRIYPVQLENFGEYKCEVSNRVSSKTSLPILFQDEWVTFPLLLQQSEGIFFKSMTY